MRTEQAAQAVQTGQSKGKVPTFSWVTGITAEQNVSGLPLHAKGTAILEIPGDSFTVEQFETADEVRAAAGEHLDSWMLDAANREYRQAQIAVRSTAARKLALAPANAFEWVRSFVVEATSIFTPVEKSERKANKASAAQRYSAVVSNIESMSKEELTAFVLAEAARLAARGK